MTVLGTTSDATQESVAEWAQQLLADAATRVPAYRSILREAGIRPDEIASAGSLPLTTKANYLTRFPLRDLMWDGDLAGASVISASSGSSGQPFYWPRGEVNAVEAAGYYEHVLSPFETDSVATLVVVAFAMGTWIGGTYTLAGIERLSREGHPITAITPGIEVDEIVAILKAIAPNYGQTIIAGYPPLVKDALDSAVAAGVDLKGLKVRLLLAGENFSEAWRAHVCGLFGGQPERDVLSMYGTADIGIVGVETPRTVGIRIRAAEDAAYRNALFGDSETLPTLIEINPAVRHVECVEGNVVLSSRGSLPLLRYSIGDRGRLLPAATVAQTLGEDPDADHRPLLALYGRDDVATSFYALNIYPENIKRGLEHPDLIGSVSGKFHLETVEDPVTYDPSLVLTVEMASPEREPACELGSRICNSVVESLRETNSEFRRLHLELGTSAEPRIVLVPRGADGFAIKVKHRWNGAG